MCPLRLEHPGFGMLASASATGRWRWRTPQWPYPSMWEAAERERRPRRNPGGRRAASGWRSHSLSFLEKNRDKRKGGRGGVNLSHLIRLQGSTTWSDCAFRIPEHSRQKCWYGSEGSRVSISFTTFKSHIFKSNTLQTSPFYFTKPNIKYFWSNFNCCNYDTELLRV